MPDLPTITVSDAQQAKILEAYKAVFGTSTTEETVAEFKNLLTEMVKAEVMALENSKLMKPIQEARLNVETQVNAFMEGIK